MSKARFILIDIALPLYFLGFRSQREVNIYYDNCIDYNKNDKQDTDENSLISVKKRIVNLLKNMTLEGKMLVLRRKKCTANC